jgi:diacylglycerol kinase (ATP)
MTVDVIVNLKARRLAVDTPLRRALLAVATRGAARVHLTNTLEELGIAVRAIATRGTDAVVLAGGDGTHMAGVSALTDAFAGAPPAIGLAPCGTVCTVARNLGARGSATATAERLILGACAGSARVRQQPSLLVRDESGEARVGFIFGGALVARFFEVYCQLPRQGLLAAARVAGRAFAGSLVGSRFARSLLDPTPCEISIDGVPHASRAWSLVVASVVRDVGLHMIVTYRAGEHPHRFHVVASGLPPRALGPQMPRVMTARPLRGEPRIDTQARALGLRFETGRGSYVLDGDVFRAREVHVGVGPELRVLSLR